MKVRLILCATALLAVLPIRHSFTQTLPACQSITSDSDGDGFGWENNASCRVVAAHSNNTDSALGQCEDRGGYPWGWNPTTLTSCRLDEQPSECIDTTPLNDGWGWNGASSCRVAITADEFRCDDTGLYPWGWNPITRSSCRLDLSGSIENLLTGFSVNTSVPRLEALLDVPLLCRKIRNDGFDDGVGIFDILSQDENVFFSGTLQYLGDSLRHSSQAPEVQSEFKFHENSEAALSTGSIWQSLDDEAVAEFHDSAPRPGGSGPGEYFRQPIASMSFTGDAQSGYLFRESSNSLFGTSQAFQTSVCVLR